MSNRATTWAWDQMTSSPMRKLVLLKLCDNADEITGECWPSVELIAKMCGCDRRTVQRHLRQLEADGVVVVVSRGGLAASGRRYASRYRVVGDWPRPIATGKSAPPPAPEGRAPECRPGAAQSPGRAAESPSGAAECRPNPSKNPSGNPAVQKQKARKRTVVENPEPDRIDDDDWQAVLDHRVSKRAKLTGRAAAVLAANIVQASNDHGLTTCKVIDTMLARGWAGCEPDWFSERGGTSARDKSGAVSGETPEQYGQRMAEKRAARRSSARVINDALPPVLEARR